MNPMTLFFWCRNTIVAAPIFAGALSNSFADGTGSSALFSIPGRISSTNIATDSKGNIYVVDRGNYRVRMVTSLGVVTTFAGQGAVGGHADGIGIFSNFGSVNSEYPSIAVDSSANVYVGETTYLRVISAPMGLVTTIAGQANAGYADGTGSNVKFNCISGISVSASGMVYVVDFGNYVVRQVTQSGTVSLLAGTAGVCAWADGLGSAAKFYVVYSSTIDTNGNLYIGSNYAVRKVTSFGLVTTLAGGGPGSVGNVDGIGSNAKLSAVYGITMSSSGILYVADGNNVVRSISSAGVVLTVAGSGTVLSRDGTFTAISFNTLRGIAVDLSNNIYALAFNDFGVRKIPPGGMRGIMYLFSISPVF